MLAKITSEKCMRLLSGEHTHLLILLWLTETHTNCARSTWSIYLEMTLSRASRSFLELLDLELPCSSF